jgi:H+/gluconate symporter-like permease
LDSPTWEWLNVAVVANLVGLVFLMLIAYRGFSVILFAPVAALLPVLLIHPSQVPEIFTSIYMEKTVYFIKLYFPLFLLGAVFGKLIEISGFAQAIVASIVGLMGRSRTVITVVMVCALLTYGGVSLFVVVFAVYPFAAEMFRQAQIPKRLIPAALALGAFSFTMDALPGTPQIQNIIPTTFFGTTAWASPVLGCVGSLFILVAGLSYLTWRVGRIAGEGYGIGHTNEPEGLHCSVLPSPWLAILPLIAVPLLNLLFASIIRKNYGATSTLVLAGLSAPLVTNVSAVVSVWALEGALLAGIVIVLVLGFRTLRIGIPEASKLAVSGALLATMNTGSEYGFGAVISALPGFVAVRDVLGTIPHPLLNAAVTTTTLAGITGSASGGLGIALGAMSANFISMAHAAGIPLEVMHRVTAMASGGMDDLPHNGAVITVLAVTGLTHRQSYPDIFAITILKTIAVFLVILVYSITRIS